MYNNYTIQIRRVVRAGRRSTIGNRVNGQNRFEGSNPLLSANKKVTFVYQTKLTFLNDAFLRNVMRTLCMMQTSPVMHAFGACKNASHHLSQHSCITYHLFANELGFCDIIRQRRISYRVSHISLKNS